MRREDLRAGLAAHQPLFGLRVRTPRVTLQLPTDPDLLDLLGLIEEGVHDPSWMPFQIAWTDTPQPQRNRDSLAHWWGTRCKVAPSDWTWSAAVWEGDQIVGVQAIFATDFPVLREVGTASWLGRAHQGRGIGKEMRSAILHLAFEGLGAARAHSGYVEGNDASRRVSETLGYTPNGVAHHVIRGADVCEYRLILERDGWLPQRRSDIEMDGLEPCREIFGVASA